jgi:hypothetical protein
MANFYLKVLLGAGDCHVSDAPRNDVEKARGEVVMAMNVEKARGEVVMAMNVEKGQWHRIESLESGTVILEMKNGAYEPIMPEDILK